ncbi:MAG: hypothetical protein FRX49_05927 [Trebouxia sp. A1-2]|nr:MAG: hypothetical protein FRX49_05927 [Trebouxia sp. A1-2]
MLTTPASDEAVMPAEGVTAGHHTSEETDLDTAKLETSAVATTRVAALLLMVLCRQHNPQATTVTTTAKALPRKRSSSDRKKALPDLPGDANRRRALHHHFITITIMVEVRFYEGIPVTSEGQQVVHVVNPEELPEALEHQRAVVLPLEAAPVVAAQLSHEIIAPVPLEDVLPWLGQALENDVCSVVVSTGWFMDLKAATSHQRDVMCLKAKQPDFLKADLHQALAWVGCLWGCPGGAWAGSTAGICTSRSQQGNRGEAQSRQQARLAHCCSADVASESGRDERYIMKPAKQHTGMMREEVSISCVPALKDLMAC